MGTAEELIKDLEKGRVRTGSGAASDFEIDPRTGELVEVPDPRIAERAAADAAAAERIRRATLPRPADVQTYD